MKKIIFVLVYSIAALSIFSYGKAAENEQLSIALSGQYANKMTDASEKLEVDTAVKRLYCLMRQMAPQKQMTFGLSSDIKNSVSLPAFQHLG